MAQDAPLSYVTFSGRVDVIAKLLMVMLTRIRGPTCQTAPSAYHGETILFAFRDAVKLEHSSTAGLESFFALLCLKSTALDLMSHFSWVEKPMVKSELSLEKKWGEMEMSIFSRVQEMFQKV